MIVGAPATMPIFTTNELEAMPPLASITVNVIVEEPTWFVAGTIVTARLLPLPVSTIFAGLFGTKVWKDELANSDKLSAGVSASLIVNDCGVVPTLICPDWLTKAEMVGLSFT